LVQKPYSFLKYSKALSYSIQKYTIECNFILLELANKSLCNKALWCNGNTSDSESAIGRVIINRNVANEFSLTSTRYRLFLCCRNADMRYSNKTDKTSNNIVDFGMVWRS